MSATPQANLYFLPWVRQGAAAAVTTVDSLGQSPLPGAATVNVALQVNSTAIPATAVQLRGPGDVLGIDPNQVVRTDPRPASVDFEPNCFPAVEFDHPDLPWLFTPAAANSDSKLRPWLCLIVLREQDGVTLGPSAGGSLPMLQIDAPADPAIELPDLTDSWAWAHTQAAATDSSSVASALTGDPALSLARLVCPRILTPDTAYLACVVPTFELGRLAGLGKPFSDSDVLTNIALAPAWTWKAQGMPVPIQLPVYYSWEFRTGDGGDFESLAARLTTSAPPGLGLRSVNIGQPGFPTGASNTLTAQVEGALTPIGGSPNPVLWSGSDASSFETALAKIVNQPGIVQMLDPSANPLLAPPLYGQWYAARSTATAQAANWFDELNLDPRWRIAAAIGTNVIQQNQEALMASAWEQAGQTPSANQRLRQLQVSMAVGERLYARHLTPIVNYQPTSGQSSEAMLLRVGAPAFSRIRASDAPSTPTLTATMVGTTVPVPSTRSAMRRIARHRGPLTRRIAVQDYTRDPNNNWVARLRYGGAVSPPAPPASVSAILTSLPSIQDVVGALWNRGFQIAAENQPLIPLPQVDLLPGNWDYPGNFRAAIDDHFSRLRAPPAAAPPPAGSMIPTSGYVLTQMNPRNSLAKLVTDAISSGPSALAPTAPGVTPIGTETVLLNPSFQQPMYGPLQDISQDLLLPGLGSVGANTVLGLQTNGAFVEAYMVGLNFEMGRELLWRGFPTDQQGTYFKNFWGYDAGDPAAMDIDDLQKNPTRVLGGASAGATAQFVFLLRSDLLRRYPNALIYLTPIVPGTSADVFPIFNGSLEPDIAFFGFPLAATSAKGNGTTTGYFVIIQEHPTEPRFGVDVGVVPPGTSHLSIANEPAGLPPAGSSFTWGLNAAHMAGITLRQPVRIAIPVTQLLS